VKERIDKATLYSDYYRDLLGDAEKKFAESVSMKQFGKGVIAFVGSNTAVAFTSFAADDVIIDELDRCNRENIVMAPERQSASLDKTNVSVSNPTFLKLGIDYEFRKSDEKWWNIKAPCGHWVQPDFFKHVVRQVGIMNS
jgi:phage terminase large subunit GpA-like protein